MADDKRAQEKAAKRNDRAMADARRTMRTLLKAQQKDDGVHRRRGK